MVRSRVEEESSSGSELGYSSDEGPAGYSSGEEGEEGAGTSDPTTKEERGVIYNVEALHDKLEEFGWSEQERWEETLVVTTPEPVGVENVEDDLEREMAFYNQALAGAKAAISRFESAGQAWARPEDYLAEMVKSDEHMAKIKEQLLHQSRLVAEMEQRRKERENKKFAKQVQVERKKARDQEKKAAIADVAKLRKQRERSGFKGELDVDAELESMKNARGSGKKPGERFTPHDKTKKRARKDVKFGFGGKKRLLKQNDAVSAANVDGYRPARPKGVKPGKKGPPAKNRPGKARRAAMKR